MESLSRREVMGAGTVAALAALGASGTASAGAAVGREQAAGNGTDTYDKVAKIVGKTMSDAFADIMQKLANGKIDILGDGNKAKLTNNDLGVFFGMLNGACATFDFSCRELKGQGMGTQSYPFVIDTKQLGMAGGGIDISVGGHWSW